MRLSTPTSIAVLLSGRGSNFEALLHEIKTQSIPCNISLVISDKPEAKGLATARAAGIATAYFERKAYDSKQAHEEAIHAALSEAGVELVCLAGYMRLLSSWFVGEWENRILNIHPSLLPAFPGLDTHARALEAAQNGNEVKHGCTVHLVDAGMDTGPILQQASLEILPQDTAEGLAARVLKLEHKLYAEALANYLAQHQ